MPQLAAREKPQSRAAGGSHEDVHVTGCGGHKALSGRQTGQPGHSERTHTVFWSQQRAVTDFSREVSGSGVGVGQEADDDGPDRGRTGGGAFPTDPPWHVPEET